MRLFYVAALLMGSLCMACKPAASEAVAASKADTMPVVERQYSLDENIGAMLLVGFRGTSIDSLSHIVRDLRQYHVGSVILFDYDVASKTRGRNITSPIQVETLCGQLRAINPDILIGIDQEGGYVSRLAVRYGFQRIPSAKQCAAAGIDTVRHYAALSASMLRRYGINLNFAPVADVDVNTACPVIGGIERSFSTDEQYVRQCCDVWIEEQARQGVVSCMKHFPGHGSSRGDTHQGLVDVTDTWQARELFPYRDLPSTTMVMTAHVVNRKLDPSGLPASLSPRITSLLRDTLGFAGVIVTDDLAMGAIAQHYSLEATIRLALLAGADLLCLSNNGGHYQEDLVPRAVKIIRQLVANGEVSEEQIALSAGRVRHLAASLNAEKH